MADAPDLGSGASRREGSSPSTRTNGTTITLNDGCPFFIDPIISGAFDPFLTPRRGKVKRGRLIYQRLPLQYLAKRDCMCP